MKPRGFLLRLLNVYADEWWMVKRLYMLQFFQGAGIAFFFTSAFAQFLARFPITELPWVILFSAGLLWITGYAYAKLEHAFSFRKFNLGTLAFSTVSMILFWLVDHEETSDAFFYLMMAWFYVLYLVDNLGFWGIASTLFDVRQSKRLFAVISGGDIPAKFVGYSVALVIVPYTGTRHLVLIGAACMLASLPSFLAILRSKKELRQQATDHAGGHGQHRTKRISKVVSNIITNTYIRRIAVISLISSCSAILFNYGLYGEVEKAYHEDVELATFIAFFYATVRIVAFITKMIFTSRLTVSIGVKAALFITPVGLILLIGSIVGVSSFSSDQKLIFYMFGVTSILVEVLKTSFNTPVLLTLMQPLPIHERLRAHNIVKGIMDPFAFFITALVLIIANYLGNKATLINLCYGLLVLGGLWITGVMLVNRRYISILIKTISSRYFTRDEFELNDEAVLSVIRKCIEKGSEVQVIGILNMINSKKIDKVSEELIIKLLHHPSDLIRIESLHVVGNKNLADAQGSLEALIENDVSEGVRSAAIKAYCKIASDDSRILHFLQHPDPAVRYSAITGMISNEKHIIRQQAELAMSEMLSSSSFEEKKRGISILKEAGDWYSHPIHHTLIVNSDYEISDLAIDAIGAAAAGNTLRSLFKKLDTHEKAVFEALYNAGENSVGIIKEQLQSGEFSVRVREKLIILLGKIGGQHAIQVLVDLFEREKKHITSIVRALHKCKYSADENMQKELETTARKYIANGVELLHMQQLLSYSHPNYQVLNNSLFHEMQNIREFLLLVFGCMYDRDKMSQVKNGLSATNADSIANAMEIIEFTVKKDLGRAFNTLFERTSIEQRCQSLRPLLAARDFQKVDQVIARILADQPIDYYNWTKACSLYVSKKQDHVIDAAMLEKFVMSDNKLLRETALFARAKILT